MTLGLTLSEVKSCVTRKARNVIYYRKTPTEWRSRVTERTERARRRRKGGSASQGAEKREARERSVRRKREERPSGRNSPTRRIDDEERRKEARKNWGAKGIPPKRPMGLCKRDIKISLQIASTTFPFRSRSAYRIETRETDWLRSVSLLFRGFRHFVPLSFLLCTCDSTDWKRERFFCNRCVSTTANRFNCHEYCPYCYCSDCQGSFADLRRDVRR